jgi:hypothetical protein
MKLVDDTGKASSFARERVKDSLEERSLKQKGVSSICSNSGDMANEF